MVHVAVFQAHRRLTGGYDQRGGLTMALVAADGDGREGEGAGWEESEIEGKASHGL